jgi:acetyl-CoA carboxylase biotin carboxyl carrier protein
VSINFTELRELIGAIAQTDIGEMTLKTEDFELMVRKESKEALATPPTLAVPALSPAPTTESSARAVPSPAPTSPAPAVDKKWVAVTSPMVGTFYGASAPDEAPFVEVGDRIGTGQTVCIIEAMKLMNEIEAELAGQVMEIVVANGEPVEYGQTLMWVDPS